MARTASTRQPTLTPDEERIEREAFLLGVKVTYWDGLYAEELIAVHFAWSLA